MIELVPGLIFDFLSVALQAKTQQVPFQVSVDRLDTVAAHCSSSLSLYFNYIQAEARGIEVTSQVYHKANLILSLISNPRALKGEAGVGGWGGRHMSAGILETVTAGVAERNLGKKSLLKSTKAPDLNSKRKRRQKKSDLKHDTSVTDV